MASETNLILRVSALSDTQKRHLLIRILDRLHLVDKVDRIFFNMALSEVSTRE
jgi:hypothetical protein